ncbi:MAG: type II toxin-antitoxin system HicA family toxin [Acidobacteria bacterium]|nr:type II toxin-antitoxin system HicA family toxin [Acidobacteriota bacterium]
MWYNHCVDEVSGLEVLRVLEGFGFTVQAQVGSHVNLRRISARGQKQVLTIPIHKELDTGTLRAIFRQASQFIPEERNSGLIFIPSEQGRHAEFKARSSWKMHRGIC